jgi:GTP-binding protein
VALLLIDAEDGVTEQDTKIAGLIHEEGKGVIIVVNKWDALDKETGTLEKYKKEVMEKLKFMSYAPVLFISAKTGQRVNTLFDKVAEVYDTARRRITTGVLNDVINDAVSNLQPPLQGTRRLKIYYATQADIQPPTFVLFVNDEELMSFSYERYLENYLRKSFVFDGTPIRLILREKNEKEK